MFSLSVQVSLSGSLFVSYYLHESVKCFFVSYFKYISVLFFISLSRTRDISRSLTLLWTFLPNRPVFLYLFPSSIVLCFPELAVAVDVVWLLLTFHFGCHSHFDCFSSFFTNVVLTSPVSLSLSQSQLAFLLSKLNLYVST